MAAAIALTKTLTATATLGRISSAYPNGRRYQSVWSGPSIDYPRQTSERSSASGNGLGLHTEWDKWPAGVVWDPRIGVRFGAFPYKITLTNEAVDGVPGSTGIAYAQYIEDHTSTTPYLRLRHAGVTAPAAGTKVLSFTINVEDCAGDTTSVDVSVTFFADDHADYSANFVWVDPSDMSPGANGVGTFADPINTLAGADVDGNPTLLGTDWNVSTGRASTRMALFKGTGTIRMVAMSNPPNGSSTLAWFQHDTNRPRQCICIEGSDITYERTATSGVTIQWTADDVTMRGFTFTSDGTALTNMMRLTGGHRQALYDLHFEDIQLTGDAVFNGGPACIGSTSDDGDYVFISHVTGHNIDNDATPVNASGLLCIFENHKVLVDSLSLTGSGATFDNEYSFRFKHNNYDSEVRRCSDLVYTPTHSDNGWAYGTGGGATSDYVRAVFRYNVVMNANRAFWVQIDGGSPSDESHSVMVHFNTLKGPVTVQTENQSGVENACEFHFYGNLLENTNHATNSGWGTLDTDIIAATGKSAVVESSIAGAIGTLVDASGIPLDSANLGQYGHTVITV